MLIFKLVTKKYKHPETQKQMAPKIKRCLIKDLLSFNPKKTKQNVKATAAFTTNEFNKVSSMTIRTIVHMVESTEAKVSLYNAIF